MKNGFTLKGRKVLPLPLASALTYYQYNNDVYMRGDSFFEAYGKMARILEELLSDYLCKEIHNVKKRLNPSAKSRRSQKLHNSELYIIFLSVYFFIQSITDLSFSHEAVSLGTKS